MLNALLSALWFFLPAGVGNVAPILVARFPVISRFNQPIDMGKTFRGKRIFGDHKTWRGLVSGIIAATLTLWLQQWLVGHSSWAGYFAASLPDYATLPTLLLGPAMGLGAIGGDAIKSFFKRQNNIAAGHAWLPFDQIDYILGASLASSPIVLLDWETYLWALILWPTIHIASTFCGYMLGLKERPL